MNDYYKILELNSNATIDEIRSAYRRLANKYHPDKNDGNKDFEEKFKEIQEAYEAFMNPSKKNAFDSTKHNQTKSDSNKKEDNYEFIYPQFVYKSIENIRKQLKVKGIADDKLWNELSSILTDQVITKVLSYYDYETNAKIIDETLLCYKYFGKKTINLVSILMVKLATGDENLIHQVKLASKRKNGKNIFIEFWEDNVQIFGIVIIILIIQFVLEFISSPFSINEEKPHAYPKTYTFIDIPMPIQESSSSNRPFTNEINYDSVQNQPTNEPSSTINYNLPPVPKDPYENWDAKDYVTGSTPACFNYTPKYNKGLDNELFITVGYKTDVVLKLVNIQNNKCIRYVYIRKGEHFRMRHIPEGKYIVKIAYGNSWRQRILNGKCEGKFISSAFYKKGQDIFDFYKEQRVFEIKNGEKYRLYNLPSFTLKLDVISTDFMDSFETDKISEDEFNEL